MSNLRNRLIERRRSRRRRPRNQSHSIPPTVATAHVRAEGCSGLRHIQIRDFQLFNDVGPDCAGFDLGPTQFELLLGALGSCLTQSFLEQAAALGVCVNHLEVDVSGEPPSQALSPDVTRASLTPRSITYTIKVDSSASSEEVERVRIAMEQSSTLLQLLVQPQMVHGTMVHALGVTPEVAPSPN